MVSNHHKSRVYSRSRALRTLNELRPRPFVPHHAPTRQSLSHPVRPHPQSPLPACLRPFMPPTGRHKCFPLRAIAGRPLFDLLLTWRRRKALSRSFSPSLCLCVYLAYTFRLSVFVCLSVCLSVIFWPSRIG